MSYFYNPENNEVVFTDLRKARKLGLYPSLTTVLKMAYNDGLEFWKEDQLIQACIDHIRIDNDHGHGNYKTFKKNVKKIADEKSKQARETGSAVHSAIETYLKQGFRLTEIEDPQIKGMFESVKNWLDENFGNMYFSDILPDKYIEYPCCDQDLKFGCRIDFIGVNKTNEIVLIDFKTQKVNSGKKPVFYNSMVAQLVGQSGACKLHIDKMLNVLVSSVSDENGVYKLFVKERTKEEQKKGLIYLEACRNLYRIEKNI